MPLIRSAVEKVLNLDPRLAEAHSMLAWVKFAFDRDWAGSDRESQLATRLNPNCVLAYHNYAFSLVPRGYFNQALEANYHAHELDPLSLHINSLRGWLLFCAGRLDEAIEQCRQAINFESQYPPSHAWLAIALSAKGNFDEARTESEIASNSSGHLPMFVACSGYCSAASGDRSGAELVVNELTEIAEERYVSPYWVAAIYAALDRRAKAFEWLQRSCDDRSTWAPFLNVDPRFESLKQDPRFVLLVQRLGVMPPDTGYNYAHEESFADPFSSLKN